MSAWDSALLLRFGCFRSIKGGWAAALSCRGSVFSHARSDPICAHKTIGYLDAIVVSQRRGPRQVRGVHAVECGTNSGACLISSALRRIPAETVIICPWTRKRSRRRRKSSPFNAFTCAHRATELWRGWGWLERSISERVPHSPVRHGRERTSRTAPDSDDRITLRSAGILPFSQPPSMASHEFSTGKP